MFLGGRIDADEGDPRTRDTVYNGGPGGKRFDERERGQVLLAVDGEEAAARADQVPDRAPQLSGQHARGITHPDRPAVPQRPEDRRVDRVVPLRLEVDDADQGQVAQLDRTGRDPVAARGEQAEGPDFGVGTGPLVHGPVPSGERGSQRRRDDPDAPVT